MYTTPVDTHTLTPQPSTQTLQPLLLFNSLLCLTYDMCSKLSLYVQFRILSREWGIDVLTEFHWNAIGDIGVNESVRLWPAISAFSTVLGTCVEDKPINTFSTKSTVHCWQSISVEIILYTVLSKHRQNNSIHILLYRYIHSSKKTLLAIDFFTALLFLLLSVNYIIHIHMLRSIST